MSDNDRSKVPALVSKINRPSVWTLVVLLLIVAALYFVAALNRRSPVSDLEEKSNALTLLTDTLANVLSAPTFAAAKLIAVPLVFIFGALVLLRIIRYVWRPPELVITDLGNASGATELDGVVKGFTHLIRENLARELQDVQRRVKIRLEDGRTDLRLKAPLSSTAVQDQSLAELVNALAEVTPAPLQVMVQLGSFVFPPRGTKVLGNLQREGDTPGKPGITFEVTDIRNELPPELHTIWEETPTEASAKTPSSTAVPKTNGLAHPDGSKQAQQYYERKQAQHYYEIGQQLGAAYLLKDAVGYLQEALKLRKNYSAAAQALAQTTSKLQDQEGNASVYATGKTLHDAGLSWQAIECYKKPLPPNDQPAAEKSWKTALQLARGKEAAAYLTLASLYRQEGVYLFEQSIALYKLAIEKGSVKAVKELESFQRHLADKLTKAGQLLHALTRYDAAETYLLMALKSVPDHPQAQAALATLRERKPPEENKEALAFFTLGELYENSGALDQAKTQYEEAVKKQPSYAEARDGLRRVLMSSGRTLSGRYTALLKPAARYLALELSKRTMLDDVSRDRTEDMSRRDEARVYNFVGACYLNSAPTYRPYYQLAIDNFEQAKQCDPKWYLPYENLGDTYSYRGKHHESLANYDEALECLKRLERMGNFRNRSNHRYTKCRIRVSQAITKLDLGEDSRQDARKEIRQIKKVRVEKRWDYDPDRAARFLYNLACWYAVAAQRKVEGKEAKEKARRYLAYSLAKNRGKDLWDRAENDEDFDEEIRTGLNDLKLELNRKMKEMDKLPELTNEQFYNVMEEVLTKAKWPTRRDALAANKRAKGNQ